MSGSMNVHLLLEPRASTPEQPRRPPDHTETFADPPQASAALPPKLTNPGLLALLGANVTEFPYSETAYVEALRLRVEQERTKQEYYRHETAHKQLMIIESARQAQVPPHLISHIFGTPTEPTPSVSPTRQPALPARSLMVPLAAPPYGSYDNASTVPPQQYRFGSPSRRPLSPAKIGAAAVANLSTPTAPYRNVLRKPKHPLHQRHYSLPSEFASPKRNAGSLTIQVKPLPAQPLVMQNLTRPPSQESMTSFQHVIQFQHWRPEDGPIDHKRRKSLLVKEYDDDDDDDVSMSHSRQPSDAPSGTGQ